MRGYKYYLPGGILIFAALLIIAVPEIIVAFVAAVFIMTGVGALYVGHRLKNAGMGFSQAGAWMGQAHDRDRGSDGYFRSESRHGDD